MRLSFVVPAYNEESYLPACLDSILGQIQETDACALSGGPADAAGKPSVEIIVVNNASSDRTAEVIAGYAQRFPCVKLVNESRKGLPFARQAGFLNSTGTLVANVDADSRLTPGWVEQVLATFAQHPELVALSGPLVYYDLKRTQRISVHLFYMLAFLVYAINRYILRAGSMVQGGNFVLERKALDQIGGFDVSIPFYGEDTDIARRLNRIGKVQFTFKLKMFSSARRLKEEGMLTIAARYTLNYFWTTFRKRPFTEKYLDIREQQVES